MVIVAAELLRKAGTLIAHDVHPQTIIAGFALASREAARYIADVLAVDVAGLPPSALEALAATTLSSKVLGGGDAQLFARMCVQAVRRIAPAQGAPGPINVRQVNMLKATGGSAAESVLIPVT